MSMMQEKKPPYVQFLLEPVEDRDASEKVGYPVYNDRAMAIITPAGSKDNVKRPVDEWLAMLRKEVRQDRFPEEWLRHYEKAYEYFLKGEELPLTGSPIKLWPGVTPSQCKTLIDLHVLTVEDLAQCNEETIARMGMGGRALKQKAMDYLSSASDHGKVTLEMETLRRDLAASEEANKELREQVTGLAKQVEALTGSLQQLMDNKQTAAATTPPAAPPATKK